MKVWDENEVLQELVAARTAEAADSIDEDNNVKKNKRNKSRSTTAKRLPFLLILARKCQRKCYELVYYPADTYERIDVVFEGTDVVLEDATSDNDDSSGERRVWINGSSDSEDDEDHCRPSMPLYYVGKAIFHTNSGETLLRMEGSQGWKEALLQKYHNLDAKSRAIAQEAQQPSKRNHTAAKAVASAAIGGGAVAGGTTLAAGAATGIMGAEAVATGGVLQSIGAVGIMANPVGMTLAAGGAIAGLAVYYRIHRKNKAKMKEQAEQELPDEDPQNKAGRDNYQKLMCDESEAPPEEEHAELWVMVAAKRIAAEETEHIYDHDSWDDRVDADQAFLAVSNNTSSKALFGPQGELVRIDTDPADRDGWETALTLHYNYLIDHNIVPPDPDKQDDAKETTRLLTAEEDES